MKKIYKEKRIGNEEETMCKQRERIREVIERKEKNGKRKEKTEEERREYREMEG
jgi:hypothetical protein